MAILPNVVYPPNILRPRTVIENSLSGGGIAGVVLGSLCGLLILLIIFWTYAQRKRRGSRNTQSRRQCDPRGDGVPNLEQHATASTRESTVPTQAVPGITPLEIDSITTVNPWKVEYQPNPVMFPHLSAPIGNIHYEDEEEGVVFSTNQTSLRRPESIIEVCGTRSNSFGTPSAIYAAANGPGSRGTSPPLQAINIRSSGDSVPPLKSSRSDLPMDNILPVMTSEVPTTYESKSPCQSGLGTVEIINTTPIKSSELYPGNSDTGVTVVSSPRSFTEASSSTRTLSLQASSRTSPTGNPSVSKVTIFPSKSIEADTDPVYPCSICHLKFRTPGLRRYVAFNHKRYSVFKPLCSPKLL
ncbi:hypothetical protein AALT_g605 [Alternaria alternata]|jgi:hypothetical protein|nr:hypothetical protein AALT_g605 [Alternaria alternata]